MSIDWNAINRALSPIKDYDDLCRRLRGSFAYPFVRETYNFPLRDLINYTHQLLGGDARDRYTEYASILVGTISELQKAGVHNLEDLINRITTPEKLEFFSEQSHVDALDTAAALKFLVYWFIPMEKYLSGLIREDSSMLEAIRILRGYGVRTNLELLQQGITRAGRKALADSSELPEVIVTELVNRADFSRLPWASKATISNIIGAGYPSLAQLASADPDQLYADYFRYGKMIGKNLKLGNEIENSYRIAKILPPVLKE